MSKYLDFENPKYEKGYKPFHLTTDSIKANIGKKICYVRSQSIDPHRGYYNVEYAVIYSKRYNQLYIEDGNNSVDIRDIVECGIQI